MSTNGRQNINVEKKKQKIVEQNKAAIIQKRAALDIKQKSQEQEKSQEQTRESSPVRKRSKLRILAKVFLVILSFVLLTCIAGAAFVFSVIREAPEIDTSNIQALLSEHSVIYDSHGNEMVTVFLESRRTNVSFECLPDNLKNAFIAVEDRTFWEHRGFNVVRIVGAIVESFQTGDRIRGTSTISQQLARNLFLMETRTEYSLHRKIIEAYYAILLERDLTKEEILVAYLNRVHLGFGTAGVQAASQAYFGKDIEDLTLAESVALASIVQEPHTFSLIRTLPNSMVDDDNENILYRDNTFTFLSNVEASERRRHLILSLMKEQGFITYYEYSVAKRENLRDNLRTFVPGETQNTSFFVDFVTRQVVEDLVAEFDIAESAAWEMLFNGGLRIHTTIDPHMQSIIEKEFADHNNFPSARGMSRDRAGNILRQGGGILLYAFNNMFDEYGIFTIAPNEFTRSENGDVLLYRGNRLNFFRTVAHDVVDYTINFRSMYIIEDGVLSTIREGVILVPAQYKHRDSDGNLVIQARFFSEHPHFFIETPDGGLSVAYENYRLNQRIIQPQAAMVIIDYETGHIKAMEGGRNVVGRLVHNRATSPRQPGSAIKTTAVYAAALQASADEIAGLEPFTPESSRLTPEISFRGRFWTAASVINDTPIFLDGNPWPRNFDRTHRGAMTMRASLINSVNVNAVKVFSQLGAERSVEFLKRLGVTSVVETGNVNDMNAAALALGGMTNGISPLEMAVSYGVFANSGRLNAPVAYTKVTNRDGEILLQNVPLNDQVIDEGVAFIMTDILRTTVANGFARRASVSGRVVAGKTGTTNDNFDAWFVGMSSGYTASVWIGNDLNMPLSEGSLSAARLWSRIMTQVLEDKPDRPFPARPENVVRVGGEYFISGTQHSPFADNSRFEKEEAEEEATGEETTDETGYSETENNNAGQESGNENQETGEINNEQGGGTGSEQNVEPEERPTELPPIEPPLTELPIDRPPVDLPVPDETTELFL